MASAKASASSASPQGKTIGDGSMSDTGPQPGLYKPKKLKKGDVPPQLKDVSLYMLDIGLLQAGASARRSGQHCQKGRGGQQKDTFRHPTYGSVLLLTERVRLLEALHRGGSLDPPPRRRIRRVA